MLYQLQVIHRTRQATKTYDARHCGLFKGSVQAEDRIRYFINTSLLRWAKGSVLTDSKFCRSSQYKATCRSDKWNSH